MAVTQNDQIDYAARLRSGRGVLRMSEVEAAERGQQLADENDETMLINMGPQHPSTHGVLRLMLELLGEQVVRSKPSSATSIPAWRKPARD
jgi:hypothetical protein